MNHSTNELLVSVLLAPSLLTGTAVAASRQRKAALQSRGAEQAQSALPRRRTS
jgi:hypothetical protein